MIAAVPIAAPALPAEPAVWLLVAAAYLLGSIPWGLWLTRWLRGVDLRSVGSGNIGTSNAGRVLGRKWGLVVFALDFAKGLVPALLARLVVADASAVPLVQVLVGTAAVVGHCYSIYLRFRGGKGVATGCGAIVAINPLIFLGGGVVWLLTRQITRYLGLASILMGTAFPILAWLLGESRAVIVGTSLLTFLVIVRHRSNIQRMLAGTEPKAGTRIDPTAVESSSEDDHVANATPPEPRPPGGSAAPAGGERPRAPRTARHHG